MRDLQDWLDAATADRWLRVTREQGVWRVTACRYDYERDAAEQVATASSATLTTALATVGLEVIRG